MVLDTVSVLRFWVFGKSRLLSKYSKKQNVVQESKWTDAWGIVVLINSKSQHSVIGNIDLRDRAKTQS